jgi:uncharacterized protein YggE
MDNSSAKDQLFKTGSLFLLVLAVLVGVMIFTQLRTYKYIGQNPTSEATITVTGDAETYERPDVIELSYSVEHLGKTPKEATEEVAKKTGALREFLAGIGVKPEDIRTVGYNLYPEYDWVQDRVAVCTATYCPPVNGKQVLKGYRLTESYELKLHNDLFDKAGDILSGIAEKGATNVSGLTFKVEKEEELLEGVRDEAIAEAKEKAERLAEKLGVEIVRVQNYNEGVNYPYYYGRGGVMETKLMAADMAPVANVQPGQEKLSTSVTITYVVR